LRASCCVTPTTFSSYTTSSSSPSTLSVVYSARNLWFASDYASSILTVISSGVDALSDSHIPLHSLFPSPYRTLFFAYPPGLPSCPVVRATRLVNGTHRFSDHQGSKTPEPIDIKLDLGDYVWDLTAHANFGISALTAAGLHMREIVIIRFFFTPRYFLQRIHIARNADRCNSQTISVRLSVCLSVLPSHSGVLPR